MMEGHYPIEYTGTDGKKGLYCNCGGPLPCPHFVPGELTPRKPTQPTDSQLFDWLQEQVVDVIYLDDGRIIDVRGNCVRTAIRTAMTTLQSDSTCSTSHGNPKSDKLTSCPTDSD